MSSATFVFCSEIPGGNQAYGNHIIATKTPRVKNIMRLRQNFMYLVLWNCSSCLLKRDCSTWDCALLCRCLMAAVDDGNIVCIYTTKDLYCTVTGQPSTIKT